MSICTPIQWFLLFRPMPGLFDQPSTKKMCIRGYKRLKPGWPVVRHDVGAAKEGDILAMTPLRYQNMLGIINDH